MMDSTQISYGHTLPDQVDRISNHCAAQLDLLSDIRDLYRERAIIEKEYAAKLQALAKKVVEKKTRKMASAVLGDEPTKTWNEDTISESTLDRAYSKIIGSIVESAQDHINLADALSSQVVDPLKSLERKHEENVKKQTQFYEKVLNDRNRVYNDRAKSKQKYDEECVELEAYRQKQDRAQYDKHADRAAKQFEQQRIDMLNAKNVFIISTTVANKMKERFYAEDLPAIENQYQRLQEHLVQKYISVLHHAQALQITHYDVLKTLVTAADTALSEVDAQRDQAMFIDYNIRPFSMPTDWAFEPCASHYDTGEMSVDDAPKVFLQNKLSKCRSKLQELGPLLDGKKKDVEQLSKLVSAYATNGSLGNIDEVIESYLNAEHQATLYATSKTILDAEIETVQAALAGDEGSQQPHSFKSSSFTIPTECGYCKSSIWGLSKQGKTCRHCGISVHSKCELKVPAECSGTREARHRSSASVSSLSRTDSVLSTSSRSSISSNASKAVAPSASSFAQTSLDTHAENHARARVVFDFTPTSAFELAVHEGAQVDVLEDDDGSGWVKVADSNGGRGLIPASYIEAIDDTAGATTPRSSTPTAVTPNQGSGQYVRAIYAYQSQGEDELGLQEGDRIELTPGTAGGQYYAEGWWEGIDSRGTKGIFPSNYVTLI
ncbi:uncharacterized protein STEHIDRAFT_79768 [Stereum hirsutum FP-91666 SS1]|uniref:uncharacterized protein n=1 Tax=Stereum hirsutum (strain FP-91666) TaxID=721885 RepID=UPI000444A7D7|nr:uncharacterized protein STEHIDRAFT_79768 [Stereum hirsutum FP-91666 SS1]EIM85766.1 hypothetical protein STEHIDRAFT_79768 [Stereum hirsutum FP-91666 SS1]